MSNKSVIIGYSGHAFVVLDILLASGIVCEAYCEPLVKSYNPYKLNYLGNESDEKVLSTLEGLKIYLGIGDNNIRSKILAHLVLHQLETPSIIHPSSTVSPLATIGDAAVIMPGVVINALSTIGKGVICNSSSIIEHECSIGNFSHVAPGAVLAGGVSVGNYSFVGANSVIKQGIRIGNHVVIGAGAVVLKDVPDNHTIFGNPAKSINNE